MKIACLHLYLATAAGDPRMILSIAQTLKAQGHQVKVYTAEFNPAILPHLHKGLDITVVPAARPLSSLSGAKGIIGKIKERFQRIKVHNEAVKRIAAKMDSDFDVVLCENDYSYKAGVPYKKINPKAKVIWIMNNPPFYHSRKNNLLLEIISWVASFFEKWSAARYASGIDWAVVYDKKNKQGSEEADIKAKIIGNPLDAQYFYAPVKKISKNEEIRLLSVGALSPFRRFEDMVSATAILRKNGYPARAILVCKDYWNDRTYRSQFEKHIQDSSVADFIDARFEGIEEQEMMRILKESHISVVPQVAKVWVATACEAMAAGLPLVITKNTSMFDVLEHNKNALFVEPKRPDQIAAAVQSLIESSDLYQRIASAGQQFVQEKLSFSYFVKELLTPPVA